MGFGCGEGSLQGCFVFSLDLWLLGWLGFWLV
jgi:hypothetical protein